MSKEERIHLRIDKNLKTRVLEIAKEQNISLSKLVENYFIELVKEADRDKPKTDEELGVEQV